MAEYKGCFEKTEDNVMTLDRLIDILQGMKLDGVDGKSEVNVIEKSIVRADLFWKRKIKNIGVVYMVKNGTLVDIEIE